MASGDSAKVARSHSLLWPVLKGAATSSVKKIKNQAVLRVPAEFVEEELRSVWAASDELGVEILHQAYWKNIRYSHRDNSDATSCG